MSQEKAQLIAPLGVLAVDGVTASGVITASSFSGNVVGSAKSLVNGSNVTVGVMTATSFDGNLTGNIQRLADSGPNINVGVTTATSFVGNLTGSVTDLTSAPAITVGMVTATTLEGPVTGNITGNISGLAGGLGVNYNGGWTGAGTSQIKAGVVTATTFYGDGSNLDGVSSGPVSQQSIGITSATTSIDLSNGNMVYANQSANTTVSFANTANGNVYFIRKKDDNTTARTITWPERIKWNGGTAPTLISDSVQDDAQVFLLVTRNMGVTWYGKEVVNLDNILGYRGFAFGLQSYGKLGLNQATTAYSSPIQVGGDTDWNAVSQGMANNTSHYLFLKSDGKLYGAGRNNQRSKLGQNSLDTGFSSPVQIGDETGWSGNMTGSSEGSMAVKNDGTLWMWGNNEQGMMGVNDTVFRSSPTQVGTDTTWSTTHNTITTNYKSSLAVKTNGTLWSWGGEDYNGALGQNQPSGNSARSSPTQVGTDTTWSEVNLNTCSLALKTNGTMWAWGYNEDNSGILAQNDQTTRSSPIQIGSGTDWASIAGNGSNYTKFAIKTNGTLWVWGRNNYGQLGVNDSGGGGSNNARSSPIQVGTDTTWWQVRSAVNGVYAIKTNGTLWAWGYNGGALGLNDQAQRSSPTQVGTATHWKTTKYGFGQSNKSFFGLVSS